MVKWSGRFGPFAYAIGIVRLRDCRRQLCKLNWFIIFFSFFLFWIFNWTYFMLFNVHRHPIHERLLANWPRYEICLCPGLRLWSRKVQLNLYWRDLAWFGNRVLDESILSIAKQNRPGNENRNAKRNKNHYCESVFSEIICEMRGQVCYGKLAEMLRIERNIYLPTKTSSEHAIELSRATWSYRDRSRWWKAAMDSCFHFFLSRTKQNIPFGVRQYWLHNTRN